MIFSKEMFKKSTRSSSEKNRYRYYLDILDGKEAVKEAGDSEYTIYLSEDEYIYPIYEDFLINKEAI